MKKLFILPILSFATAAFSAPRTDPTTAPFCPHAITLSSPAFLGGAAFPTKAQIETNFNKYIRAPGDPNPVWGQDSLTNANNLVQAFEKENDASHKIVLNPTASGDSQTCSGTFAGYSYTYDSTQCQLLFTFGGDNSDNVSIAMQDKSPVNYNVSLPSNCSACSHTAELFVFGTASVSSN